MEVTVVCLACFRSAVFGQIGDLIQETLHGPFGPQERLDLTKVKELSAEAAVREIRRRTRRKFSPDEKIRIVLEGLRAGRGALGVPRGFRRFEGTRTSLG